MGSRHDDVLQTAGGRPPDAWLDDAIARDPVLEPIAAQLRRLGAGDAPVLIAGEPGSGRELAARAIHNLSSRASHPFVQIDCSSLSEPLIEAELLGVGGQTGGPPYKMGIFEQAAAGTVFVAEVARAAPARPGRAAPPARAARGGAPRLRRPGRRSRPLHREHERRPPRARRAGALPRGAPRAARHRDARAAAAARADRRHHRRWPATSSSSAAAR